MSIIVNTKDLNRALAVVGKAAAKRATLPICQNVLIEADSATKQLTLTCTDLDVTAKAFLPFDGSDFDSLTVSHHLLQRLAKASTTGLLLLTSDAEHKRLRIGSTELSAERDAADFPLQFSVEPDLIAALSAHALRAIDAEVCIAVAQEDSRPVFCTVHVELESTSLTATACDGFRLVSKNVYATIACTSNEHTTQRAFNISARLIQIAAEAARKGIDAVSIKLQPTTNIVAISLDCGDLSYEFIGALNQATFPNYKAIMPDSTKRLARVTFKPDALRDIVAEAFQLSRVRGKHDANSNIVRLVCTKDVIDVSSLDMNTESTFSHGVAVCTDGELPSKVALNGAYLLDALKSFSQHETATLDLFGPSQYVLLTAPDGTRHVIMPMLVHWEAEPAATEA